jgi:hypothetical protein
MPYPHVHTLYHATLGILGGKVKRTAGRTDG